MPYIIGLLAVIDGFLVAGTLPAMGRGDKTAGIGIMLILAITWVIVKLTALWLVYSGAKGIYKDFNRKD